MKIKACVSLTCLLLGSILAPPAMSEAKYKFKMTSITPKGSLTFKLFPKQIADKVAVVTDGKVSIKPFGGFVLASIFEGHKAVLDGRADMALHYPVFEINQNPASAFIGDMPGGMSATAKIFWVLGGGGKKLWAQYRNSMGLHGLFCGAIGSEIFAHSHKKIQNLSDLKGFKYRTAGANTWVMKKLGASPTLVPGPEVFTLLERKGVDGAEYLDPFGNYSLGIHKVAKYVVVPGIHAPGGLYELLMKKSTWDAFPEDIKKKMEIVCDSTMINAFSTLNANNADAIEKMSKNSKNEIVQLSPEFLAAVRKAGRDWAEEKIKEQNAKGNPWMEKLARSYFAFQDKWKKNKIYYVTE